MCPVWAKDQQIMLKTLKLFLIVSVLISGIAHAEEVAPVTPVPPATPKSCMLEDLCVETSADFSEVQAQNNCSKINGKFSTALCPKENLIGSCAEKTKSAKAYTAFYYNQNLADDPEELKMDCSFRSGLWSEGSSMALN
jgi:hypothetical protein